MPLIRFPGLEVIRKIFFPFGLAVTLSLGMIVLAIFGKLPDSVFFSMLFVLSFGTKVINAIQSVKHGAPSLIKQFVAYMKSPADSWLDIALLGVAINAVFIHSSIVGEVFVVFGFIGLLLYFAFALPKITIQLTSIRRHNFTYIPMRVKPPEDDQLN